MLTKTHYPENLLPDQLDEYLAKGWFRMGQMIFTCHFLCLQGDVYSPIWMRLSLAKHRFRKRMNKKMRQVEARFRIEVKIAEINETKEQLYQYHRSRFEGFISETLAESLMDFSTKNIYQTHEINVYDGEKLIAVSFFDMGKESIASILGMFHPDYAQYSLGFYTMMAEMKYGQELGLTYYYPGYVVHNYPKFDYKLRLGEMEYFDFVDQEWLPFAEFDSNRLPAVVLKSKLKKIQALLHTFNIDNHRLLYPLYDKVTDHDYQETFMSCPLFVACNYHYLNDRIIAIEYDLKLETYQLSIYSRLDNLFFFFPFLIDETYDMENTYFDYLIRERIVLESDLPEMILYALQSILQKKLNQKDM